ncbi:MAG: hypothetical protein IKB94_06170, partial [Clostridia bacterium]|nr:hypothetical protein [Clostridia bacterium]
SDFLRDGFLSYQGTKRSKSCRIYEYFNEEMAKIRPKKTGSDYTLHPILTIVLSPGEEIFTV